MLTTAATIQSECTHHTLDFPSIQSFFIPVLFLIYSHIWLLGHNTQSMKLFVEMITLRLVESSPTCSGLAVSAVSAQVLGCPRGSAVPQNQAGEGQLPPGGTSHDSNAGELNLLCCSSLESLSLFLTRLKIFIYLLYFKYQYVHGLHCYICTHCTWNIVMYVNENLWIWNMQLWAFLCFRKGWEFKSLTFSHSFLNA